MGSLSRTFASLVNPAPLLLRRVPDLPHRLPEAQRPVADRQARLDLQATGLHVQQQFLPGLLALPVAVADGDQLLLPLGGRPHQHQDALPAPLQADVEVDAVGPDVDVTLARQRPLAPRLMVGLPDGLEPGDGRGREVGGVRPEDRLEGLGEVAGADALEVEPGDQLLQAPGPPQVGGQDGGGELLPLAPGPAGRGPWAA